MTAYRLPMQPVSPNRLPTQHSKTPHQPLETRQLPASEGKLTLNLTHKVKLHPNLAQGWKEATARPCVTSRRSSRPRPRFWFPLALARRRRRQRAGRFWRLHDFSSFSWRNRPVGRAGTFSRRDMTMSRDSCDLCQSDTFSEGVFRMGKLLCRNCASGNKPPVTMPPTPQGRRQIERWCSPRGKVPAAQQKPRLGPAVKLQVASHG